MGLNKIDERIEFLEEKIKQYQGKLTLKILLMSLCNTCYDEEFFKVNFKNGDKGVFGNLLQDRFFGIIRNNSKGADFESKNVELKCTGLLETKNGMSAKERLVLSLINYDEFKKQNFEEALSKSANLYLVFFIYDENKDFYDWNIVFSGYFNLNELAEETLKQLRLDFDIIQNKVQSGKAGEISGADTVYLEACPKGTNREKSQVQFEGDKVQRRALAFKKSLLTKMLRDKFTNH